MFQFLYAASETCAMKSEVSAVAGASLGNTTRGFSK